MRRTLAVPAVLPLLAILAAEPVSDFNDFGVQIEFYRDAHKQAEMMAAAGIRWVRMDLAWITAEPEVGQYDFRAWDRYPDAFEPFGIRTLFILDYGNRLYQGGLPPSTASGRAAFAAFISFALFSTFAIAPTTEEMTTIAMMTQKKAGMVRSEWAVVSGQWAVKTGSGAAVGSGLPD